MPTPKVLPKEHAFAPTKYDVEDSMIQTNQEAKLMNKMGICELDDEECRKNSAAQKEEPPKDE